MARRDVPPARHSDPSTDKAAQLREIAAKVRQVPGCFKDEELDVFWYGRVAFGRLIVEAYDAGAWHKEGSFIGDKLRMTLTSTDRDRPLQPNEETVPAWLVEAASAVIDTLTEHLVPPESHGKAEVEWEAGILANEIEREARAATGSPPDELLAKLSGTEQRIVNYLWNRSEVERSTFVKAIYDDKTNTPDAEEKAIRRLQNKFYKLRSKPKLRRYGDIRIELRAGYVTFDRPDK